MRYLGGKFRVRYQISEYINSLSIKTYLEPFCGACWVGERVRARQRYFTDSNLDLILLWNALQRGWTPPKTLSEAEYENLRSQEASALRGFAGFSCSFGGKWFGGYARGEGRDYIREARRTFRNRMGGFGGSVFARADYREAVELYKTELVYCDPPYAGTTGYGAVGDFNTVDFWDEIRTISQTRLVLVSEYEAPSDFREVVEAKSRMGLAARGGKELRVERLFAFESYKGHSRVAFSSLLEG